MTISELRDKLANLWKSMTAFLDTRTGSDGVLSAEDDASYAKVLRCHCETVYRACRHRRSCLGAAGRSRKEIHGTGGAGR